jgi:hypothetical protein
MLTTARERREGYRVRYPTDLCPVLTLCAGERLVLDISEWGIRFIRMRDEKTAFGQRFIAAMSFRYADYKMISGRIVRISECDVAAILDHGFDFELISREHDLIMSCLP